MKCDKNRWHDGALVGGRHQCAEVRLVAHAQVRRTLVLHVLRDAGRGHEAGGTAVGAEVAISCQRS